MLSNPHHFAPKLSRADFKPSEIFQWDSFVDIGLPLVLGGIILAIPVFLFSYVVVLFIMRERAARRALRLQDATSGKGWEQP